MAARRHKAPYTDEEAGLLADESLSHTQVAEWINRSPSAVRQARRRLRLGELNLTGQEWWREDEVDLILEHVELPASQIAAFLFRTPGAVGRKRWALAKAGITKPRTTNSNPHWVGQRQLLAATCPECGVLMDARAFHQRPDNNRWRRECRPCSARIRNSKHSKDMHNRNRRRESQSVARLQAITIPKATRRRAEWTGPDYEVLSDPGLTLLEKALRLQRTYIAVQTRASRMGCVSRRQNSIDETDLTPWVIDAPNAERLMRLAS